jgi:hypothetical protein
VCAGVVVLGAGCAWCRIRQMPRAAGEEQGRPARSYWGGGGLSPKRLCIYSLLSMCGCCVEDGGSARGALKGGVPLGAWQHQIWDWARNWQDGSLQEWFHS